MTAPKQLDALRVPIMMAMQYWPDLAESASRLLDALNSEPDEGSLVRMYLASSLVMGWATDATAAALEVLSGLSDLIEKPNELHKDIGPEFRADVERGRLFTPDHFGRASLVLLKLQRAHEHNNMIMSAIHEQLTDQELKDLEAFGEIMTRMQNQRSN